MIKNKFFLSDYVPKRYDSDYDILEKFKRTREYIWSFKNGGQEGQNYFFDDVVSYINRIKKENSNKEIIIIPIPASNSSNTRIRFYNFLNKICEKTNIINGYNFVISPDHQAAHLGGTRTHSFLKNDVNQFSNDDIVIIFDDIYTTGNSFLEVSNLFTSNDIYGIFLGKTINGYDLINYINLPMED